MNSKIRIGAWVVFTLLLATVGLRPLESKLAGTEEEAGGMRRAVAGGFWLRANLAWEQEDAAATTAFLQLAVLADGNSPYFRCNGARMIAYDFAQWRMHPDMPEAVRRKIREEQAQVALAFLVDGLHGRSGQAELLVEMATIRLRVFNDREGAAAFFRRAAGQPHAPFYAARIHAELLIQLGRSNEALVWLKQIQPALPANDPAACREVVAQRIKALEDRLAAR